MVDPVRIEERRAAFDPMDRVAFAEEKLGEISAVLSSDASNERALLHGTTTS
jgi:hypothetical protein